MVIKVRLKGTNQERHFEADEDVKVGDYVMVKPDPKDANIVELGEVVRESSVILKSIDGGRLPKILRKASKKDIQKFEEKRKKEEEAYEFCKSRIKARELPMKLLRVNFLLDEKKAIFFFTAEGRIDFRDLVKDLARKYRIRIEMKQIGVRDEAKMVGGFGICGKPLCCWTFLKKFDPVTIQKARDQNINVNPTKISGVCGRLVCCLNYEEAPFGRLYVERDEEDEIQYDEEELSEE